MIGAVETLVQIRRTRTIRVSSSEEQNRNDARASLFTRGAPAPPPLADVGDELRRRLRLLALPSPRRVHHQPRDAAEVVLRAPAVRLQEPLHVPPRGRLVPAPPVAAPRLQPPPPLGLVPRPALDDRDPGPVGRRQPDQAVQVGPAGEGRVDDDGEAAGELGGGDGEDHVVGEVVEEAGRGLVPLLEGESAVADVVLVEEGDLEGGGQGAGEGGLAGARVPLHGYDDRRAGSVIFLFLRHLSLLNLDGGVCEEEGQ